MPKIAPTLTDTAIKAMKYDGNIPKNNKKSGGKNLYILITRDGKKWWRYDYIRPSGGRNSITIGDYSNDEKLGITLASANKIRDEYNAKVKQGIDPSNERKEAKQIEIADTAGQFHLVVIEWLKTQTHLLPVTFKKQTREFEKSIFAYPSIPKSIFCKYDKDSNIISSRPIKEIGHDEIYNALKAKELESIDTAKRLRNRLEEVWLYAIAKKYTNQNIIANISKKAFATYETKHHAKIVDENVLKELMESIEAYNGVIVRYALKFVLMNPFRVMNLGKDSNGNDRALRWEWVDLENGVIKIPREKMKMKNRNFTAFTMPLSTQSVELLKEIKDKWTGHTDYVFASIPKNEPINKESTNRALKRMGFNDEDAGRKTRNHGFRGTFRSLARTKKSQHDIDKDVMEACLDHHTKDMKERAYDHLTDYTDEMKVLLQWWADYLDSIKAGG